jgi:hypothetical protein
MESHTQPQRRPVALILIFLLILQASLAARLVPHRDLPTSSLSHDALGSARALLAASFYKRADLYFHRGVKHTEVRALETTWFAKASRTISPRTHAHLEGDGVSDMLPWLSMTIKADPAGEDAYLVAAHWLSKSLGRHDEALLLLRSGLLSVQHPYRLLVSRGKILLRQQRWHDASQSLSGAIRQIVQLHPSPTEENIRDLREALLLHAFASEADESTENAIRSLESYLTITPTAAPQLRMRLESLQAGTTPARPATAFFASQDDDDHDIVCGRDDTKPHNHDEHSTDAPCSHEACSH